jgi:hypothetical protein
VFSPGPSAQQTEVEEIVMPETISDLITILDETFPSFNPTLDMNSDEIRFKAGQRSVVEWLLRLKKEQENDVFRR